MKVISICMMVFILGKNISLKLRNEPRKSRRTNYIHTLRQLQLHIYYTDCGDRKHKRRNRVNY